MVKSTVKNTKKAKYGQEYCPEMLLTVLDSTLDHTLDSTLDCIVTKYIMQNCIHTILYPTTNCTGLTLRPIFYILQYCNSIRVTLRHLFFSWGIFDSISNCINDSISSSKY